MSTPELSRPRTRPPASRDANRQEQRYLPPSLSAWRQRIRLLSDNLRKTTPCRDAMRTTAAGSSTWNGYCIDGAITVTAERQGIIHGQWVMSDYSAHPDTENPPMTPHLLSPDGRTLLPAPSGTFSSVTRYEYFMPRHRADPERPFPSQSPNAPAEARLWLGLDLETPSGAHRDFICNALPPEAVRHVQENYDIQLPDAAQLPRLNNIIYDQNINPLRVIADLLERSLKTPMPGLWHPAIRSKLQLERAFSGTGE